MIRHFLIGVVAVGAGTFYGPSAEAAAIRCESCQDDGDFRAEAVNRGTGTHIVYNVSGNKIQQWYVGSGGGGGGVPLRTTTAANPVVRKQTPPPGASEEVRRAHELYVSGGGTIRPTYNVPVSMLGLNPDAASKTAYEFVRDANLRAMIESATGNVNVISSVVGANVLTAMTDLLQLASNYTGLRDQARIMYKVVFKDGSYVTIIVNLENQNGNTEPGSARTGAGQLIPSDIQEVQGDWTDYGGENLNRMAEHMQSLGATIKVVGSQGGSVRAISCSGSGVQQVCLVQYRTQ
ncbi:hypothetical protein [uncultured Xanthomonas sp.]|nr:hypothetical protein [uncultured Xanthomonas sp.]